MATKKKTTHKTIEALRHEDAKRKNIPTAEHQSVVSASDAKPITLRYPRNTDLDPQLVWRGKDEQDWSDLVVHAPPLYIQEKVHPKVLIDDLLREFKAVAGANLVIERYNPKPDSDEEDAAQLDGIEAARLGGG